MNNSRIRPVRVPRLPVEVHESIIDRVYHPSTFNHHGIRYSQAALSQCALVCREWRTRAQMRLFHSVELRNSHHLHTFAELLDESPVLGSYVQVVLVHGSSHYTPDDSILPLFPTVLPQKLPNLQEVSIYNTGLGNRSRKRSVRRPGPRGITLPHIPLHPRFPILLEYLQHLTTLRLGVLIFPSFGDFARILDRLTGLGSLVCDALDWSTLGIVPPCMAKGLQGLFLPTLSNLKVIYLFICVYQEL